MHSIVDCRNIQMNQEVEVQAGLFAGTQDDERATLIASTPSCQFPDADSFSSFRIENRMDGDVMALPQERQTATLSECTRDGDGKENLQTIRPTRPARDCHGRRIEPLLDPGCILLLKPPKPAKTARQQKCARGGSLAVNPEDSFDKENAAPRTHVNLLLKENYPAAAKRGSTMQSHNPAQPNEYGRRHQVQM